ncbi:MAG: hypothetical protein OEU26_00885 [Candidatus Tectomicrobia bacterium]|nr:hypothetical protein [Candidatus Tectomicrobia bacterium]
MPHNRERRLGWSALWALGASLMGIAILWIALGGRVASEQPEPVVMRSGWQFAVFKAELPGVDNLALDEQGTLYATLESEGKVVAIREHRVEILLRNLRRPDGLLYDRGRLFITEEIDAGRVLQWDLKTRQLNSIAELRKPEGIDRLPNGDLLISEDVRNGRVVRVSKTGEVKTVARDLQRPEGLRLGPEDKIYVAETNMGRILEIAPGQTKVIVAGLHEPDQIAFGPDGALWITEDQRPGRVLRYQAGVLEVIAEGMKAPQGIAFGRDNTVYIAEQGRDRILALHDASKLSP